MLLAIDTSVGTSVAIVDRDLGIIAEHSSTDPRGHAEVVGEFIKNCLTDWGGDVTTLSGVVAGMGPGPFTGLRVGIAAARAFAFGSGTPLVPVISHDAIAFGATEPVLVVTDARRREVFFSTYSGTDDTGLPIRLTDPALAPAAELENHVSGYASFRLLDGGQVSAGALGMVAELMYAQGRQCAADTAVYLRSPDVTLSAGPKRVTS